MAVTARLAVSPPSATTAEADSPCRMSSPARSAETAEVWAISVMVLAVSVTAATCSVVAEESWAAADWSETTMSSTREAADWVPPTIVRRLPVIRRSAAPSSPGTSVSRRRSPWEMVRAWSTVASSEVRSCSKASPRSPAMRSPAAASPRASASIRRTSSSIEVRDWRKASTSPPSPRSSWPRSPAAMALIWAKACSIWSEIPVATAARSPISSVATQPGSFGLPSASARSEVSTERAARDWRRAMVQPYSARSASRITAMASTFPPAPLDSRFISPWTESAMSGATTIWRMPRTRSVVSWYAETSTVPASTRSEPRATANE